MDLNRAYTTPKMPSSGVLSVEPAPVDSKFRLTLARATRGGTDDLDVLPSAQPLGVPTLGHALLVPQGRSIDANFAEGHAVTTRQPPGAVGTAYCHIYCNISFQ